MFSSLFGSVLGTFISTDSTARFMQGLLVAGAFVVLFFLLFTVRDILQRTRSFFYQAFCILLVAFLPGLGFLLYLLLRPSRTINEREMEVIIRALAVQLLHESHLGGGVAIEEKNGHDSLPSSH